MRKPLHSLCATLTFMAGLAVGAAQAAIFVPNPITATGSSQPGGSVNDLSAQLDLSVLDAHTLQMTLTNTSAYDVLVPSQVLTAVFFDLSPTLTLTPVSAVLNSGSTVWANGNDITDTITGGVVGGEWAYKSGLSGAPAQAGIGISSSGLSLFGKPSFPGVNLAGPKNGAVDGLQYGITSAGDDVGTYNGGTSVPLIKSSVVFTFLTPVDLTADTKYEISNITFQYGTSLCEPSIVPSPPVDPHSIVPEPTTIVVWSVLGAAGVGAAGLRRKKRGWSSENRQAIMAMVERGRHTDA